MSDKQDKLERNIIDDYRKQVPQNIKFLLETSVRAIAATIVQPIDVIKIRIQLCISVGLRTYPTSLRGIIAKEGISVLYHGLSAAVLKQIMTATTRMSVYSLLFHYIRTEDGKFPTFSYQVAVEIFTVACGAFVSAPAELGLVRMTADTCMPMRERKNYKNVIDALKRIHNKEGTSSLWRGAVPMVLHAVFGKGAGIMFYPLIMGNLKAGDDSLSTRIVASTIVEFISSIIALPSDIIKTKLQSMGVKNGKSEFKGPLDALRKIIKQDRFMVLWKGFIPYYLRRATHTMLSIIMLEYSYTILLH